MAKDQKCVNNCNAPAMGSVVIVGFCVGTFALPLSILGFVYDNVAPLILFLILLSHGLMLIVIHIFYLELLMKKFPTVRSMIVMFSFAVVGTAGMGLVQKQFPLILIFVVVYSFILTFYFVDFARKKGKISEHG